MPINANLVTTDDLETLKAEIFAEFNRTLREQRSLVVTALQSISQIFADPQADFASNPDLGAQARHAQQAAAAAGQQVQDTTTRVRNGSATKEEVEALKETVKNVTDQVTELKAELERRVAILEADVAGIKLDVADLQAANNATEQWKVSVTDTVDNVKLEVEALKAAGTVHDQWKVTVDDALANQATSIANHDTALTNHTAAINSIGVALNGTQAAAGQPAVIGLRERTLKNETDIEEIKEQLTKNKFNVWVFLAFVVAGAIIGTAVGQLFWSAWVLGLMIGIAIGSVGGFIAAISNVSVPTWRRTPAQPATPPAPGTPVPPAPAPAPQP